MLKVFNYFGSKNSPSISRWIISNLPEHDRYLEPFGGSAAILLNKQRCDREIYSDVYQPAINFFRFLQSKPLQLVDMIDLMLMEEIDRRFFTKQIPIVKDRSLSEAALFYLYCHYSWSGGGTNWSSGFSSDAGLPAIWHLIETGDRIQNVEIQERDAFDAIREFPDDERSLIYVDPPYLPTARKSKDNRVKDKANSMSRRRYAHELTIDQHIELAGLLQNRSAIVSGYDSEFYETFYVGWERRSMNHAGDTEFIWISPVAQEMRSQLSFDFSVK
jgi:DNA adenine methylase